MKKFTLLIGLTLLVFLAASQRGVATGDTSVTGAAEGAFASGASIGGVTLQGSTLGMGVTVYSDGTAEGDFQTVLAGVAALGTPQYISIEGKVKAGTTNTNGSVTFSGDATVDMGDGTLPLAGVAFSVTTTTQGLQLVVGATSLAPQTLSAGSITIQ